MMVLEKIKKNKLLFIVLVIYVGLFILMPSKAMKSVKNSVYYLIEMVEILPVVFVLTAIIETWVPKEVIMKRFGEGSGFLGNLLSLILGSISAGPIYAAFPIGKMLLSKGASITNIVIILSSWAVIKLPMLANEAKFLGVRFMIVRWILTVVGIMVMAYLVALIVKKKDLPNVQESEAENTIFEINKQYCVGCGVCAKMLPEYYEIIDNKARIKELPIKTESIGMILSTIQNCPTHAIVFESK